MPAPGPARSFSAPQVREDAELAHTYTHTHIQLYTHNRGEFSNHLNAYLIVMGPQQLLVQLESTTKKWSDADKQYLQASCLLPVRVYMRVCVCVRECFYDFD